MKKIEGQRRDNERFGGRGKCLFRPPPTGFASALAPLVASKGYEEAIDLVQAENFLPYSYMLLNDALIQVAPAEILNEDLTM